MSPLSRIRLASFFALTGLAICAGGHRAAAQATAPPAVPPAALPIALPDGAKLQTELDGSDADILGMVKSLVEGVADPGTATPAPKKPTAPNPKPNDDDVKDAGPDWLGIISDGQLSAFLKDVHRLHFVSYTLPAAAPGVGTGTTDDVVSFYEKPYQEAGGHRLLWQTGNPQVLVEGFEPGQGFAAVFHGGTNVVVLRADGYPNMKIIGTLIRTFIADPSSMNFGGSGAAEGKEGDTGAKPAAKGAASGAGNVGKKAGGTGKKKL